MDKKKTAILLALAVSILLMVSSASAATSASIEYTETDLGGLWQYNYTFYNTSTASEALYNVYFDFAQVSSVTGSALPSGWDGTVWVGTNNTDYIDTFSTNAIYDISAGSSLSGFSFTIDYQAGDIPYTAYFDTGSGTSFINGFSSMVPEPISAVLFIAGGGALGLRRFWKKRITD